MIPISMGRWPGLVQSFEDYNNNWGTVGIQLWLSGTGVHESTIYLPSGNKGLT